jgi:ATP-dependent Clp protease ATP-binding subunit ClpA
MKRLDALLVDRKIVLELKADAWEWFAEKGYDAAMAHGL